MESSGCSSGHTPYLACHLLPFAVETWQPVTGEAIHLGLNEEEIPEVYVKREIPEAKLNGDPRVVEYKAVWYICPYHFTRQAPT